MADLNALIAQGYQSQPLPDPFVQYSKMQQLENSATQNRLAQQQMQENAQMAPLRMREMEARLNISNLTYEQTKGAQDFITGVMQKAKENGSDVSDPMDAAKQMLMHPNPTVQGMGKHLAEAYQLLQGIEQQQLFNKGEPAVAPTVAPTAAYTPQRILVGSQSVQPSALGSGTFDVNAPAVAAPAAAAPAAPTDKLGQIEARIAYLRKFSRVPDAKSEREELIKLRAELSKPHVVGNVMLDGVGNVIYKGPAKSSIQQRLNADQTTSFVSVDDDTGEATPILIDGQPLISARKVERKIMGNLLLDDTGNVIFEGPAGSTIQQVTKGDTISFVSVDNKTNVAKPIMQDGKPLTSVSIPAQDLAFRQREAAFKQAHPTLSIQRVGQSDGSEIIVAVNTQNATYQPVVAQGDTFVPAGPEMPISGGMPSAAAPSAAAPSAAAPAAAIAPEAGAAPAAAIVPNALVGTVNNALLSTSTGAGRPLISAPKPTAPPTDQALMTALGFPLTTAGYTAFKDAQRQDRLLNPAEEAQKVRIALASRPPGGAATPAAPVAVVGTDGKIKFVSREEAIAKGMTPASAQEGLAPKEIQNREAKFPQAKQSVATISSTMNQIEATVDRLLANEKGLNGITGFIGGRTVAVTNESRKAEADLKQLKNLAFVQGLTELRAASSTGAGVGNVSNKEGDRFENLKASLDQTQSTEDLKDSLKRLKSQSTSTRDTVNQAFEDTYAYRANAPAAAAAKPSGGAPPPPPGFKQDK